jgi:hypothetical protein
MLEVSVVFKELYYLVSKLVIKKTQLTEIMLGINEINTKYLV